MGSTFWSYVDEEYAKENPQSFAEQYFLGLLLVHPTPPKPKTRKDSAANGLLFYQRLQLQDGHWGCGLGGMSFTTPDLVFAMYITKTPIPTEWNMELRAYIAHQVLGDGGWGLCVGSETTVWATALHYVALRLLGVDAFDPFVAKARERLLTLGGAIGVPQWGKFWLCALNLYHWEGVNPVPPELWLLPEWLPFHPWRWWVLTRSVYLPASFLYVNKCQMPLTPLLEEIREEIYVQPFSSIVWKEHGNTVAACDLKRPPSVLRNMLNPVFRIWDTYLRPSWLHKKINHNLRHLMQREDGNTSYGGVASISQFLISVAVHFDEGEGSISLSRHREKFPTFLIQSAEGMSISGTDGVQVWDTAFSILATVEAGLAQDARFRESMTKALEYLDISQLREDLADPYRQPRKGGWSFSTKENGFVVSDCSGEAMKAVILLQEERQVSEES